MLKDIQYSFLRRQAAGCNYSPESSSLLRIMHKRYMKILAIERKIHYTLKVKKRKNIESRYDKFKNSKYVDIFNEIKH